MSTTVKAEHYDVHGKGVRDVELAVEYRETGLVGLRIKAVGRRYTHHYVMTAEAWNELRAGPGRYQSDPVTFGRDQSDEDRS